MIEPHVAACLLRPSKRCSLKYLSTQRRVIPILQNGDSLIKERITISSPFHSSKNAYSFRQSMCYDQAKQIEGPTGQARQICWVKPDGQCTWDRLDKIFHVEIFLVIVESIPSPLFISFLQIKNRNSSKTSIALHKPN